MISAHAHGLFYSLKTFVDVHRHFSPYYVGFWVVCISRPMGEFSEVYKAVQDDFGTLVRVP